jgi:hypothetical protein
MEIFIPGNVPSSKNSRLWTGKFLISSPTTQRYKKATEHYFLVYKKSYKKLFGNKYPIQVGLYFVRDSKRRFDYINACQIIADLMVKYDWLPDDSADYFVPVFLGYHIDKKNAGVIIKPILMSPMASPD